MVTRLSVQNNYFTRNARKSSKKKRTKEQSERHLWWHFTGMWQSLWRSILESLYINTSPFRNKRYDRVGSTQSLRRNLHDTFTFRFGWKVVGWLGMLLQSSKSSRPLFRTANLSNERRIGEPFCGPIIPCTLMVDFHPVSSKDQSTLHQFG